MNSVQNTDSFIATFPKKPQILDLGIFIPSLWITGILFLISIITIGFSLDPFEPEIFLWMVFGCFAASFFVMFVLVILFHYIEKPMFVKYKQKHKEWCLHNPLIKYEYPDNVDSSWIIVRRTKNYYYSECADYNLMNKYGELFSKNWFKNIYRTTGSLSKYGPFVFVENKNNKDRMNILRWIAFDWLNNLYDKQRKENKHILANIYTLSSDSINKGKSKPAEKLKLENSKYRSVWLLEDYYGYPMFVCNLSEVSKKGYICIENDEEEVSWYNPDTDKYWIEFGDLIDNDIVPEKWIKQNKLCVQPKLRSLESPLYLNTASFKNIKYVDEELYFTKGYIKTE